MTAPAGALRRIFRGPQSLALIPALTLGAFWLGGEPALIAAALMLPLALATIEAQGVPAVAEEKRPPRDPTTGLPGRATAESRLDRAFAGGKRRGAGCLVVAIDGMEEFVGRCGIPAADAELRRIGGCLSAALRGDDLVVRLEGAAFAVVLDPVRHVDIEVMLQIAARLQETLRAPVGIDGPTGNLAASAGFCLPDRSPARTGAAMLAAAETAAADARAGGPGAIRAFTTQMRGALMRRDALSAEIEQALGEHLIRPWFQPQISTDTGEVTGFEALARWPHPERGLIPPADFLPLIARAGFAGRMNAVMLHHAFSALAAWRRAGCDVPAVGVSFSGPELHDPALVGRIAWELDRFGLNPGALTAQVAEAVVSDRADAAVMRNLAGLTELGCGIDLDDFGGGHAAITAIRRVAPGRLRLDRRLVRAADSDAGQRQMLAAILAMTARLKLDTLAAGVETLAEHATLAQLGCGHVQGAATGRPMPFEDTIAWMQRHRGKLAQTPRIGKRTG